MTRSYVRRSSATVDRYSRLLVMPSAPSSGPRLMALSLPWILSAKSPMRHGTTLRSSSVARCTPAALNGAGGCGKTRLAVHIAGESVEKFADGVCFVPLATITNLDLVAPAIAQALHLREEGERSIEELLCDYVRDKSLLLVLDNFEQVVQASSLVSELLNASKLKALVTR